MFHLYQKIQLYSYNKLSTILFTFILYYRDNYVNVNKNCINIKNNNLLKGKSTTLEGSDTREGLTAVISVNIPENILQFEGQTKGKLGTPEARPAVEQIVYDALKFYLEENKSEATIILDKMSKSKFAREAARKAREEARAGRER